VKAALNISPGGAFRVGLAGGLAILNVVGVDVEAKVVATVPIFVMLPLAHPGCCRLARDLGCGEHRPWQQALGLPKSEPDKNKTDNTCDDPDTSRDIGNFYFLDFKPPPRMPTANKIAPKMNDIVCSVIARLIAHDRADTTGQSREVETTAERQGHFDYSSFTGWARPPPLFPPPTLSERRHLEEIEHCEQFYTDADARFESGWC
jgi:hypothetical protein